MNRLKRFQKFDLLIVAVPLLAIAAVLYSMGLMSNTMDQDQPLVGITENLKLKVAIAHLWFEEAISGDESINLSTQVYANIDEALALANAMLDGGQTSGGMVRAIGEGAVRDHLLRLRQNLQAWRTLTDQRWRERATSTVGTEIDQAYDAMFEGILRLADANDKALDQIVAQDQAMLTRINFAIIGLLLVLFAGMSVLGGAQPACSTGAA